MEGNEIEKAAEELANKIAGEKSAFSSGYEGYLYGRIQIAFTAGANWQKERENAELTRANARIEELTSQNLELVRKYDDLYRKANGQ